MYTFLVCVEEFYWCRLGGFLGRKLCKSDKIVLTHLCFGKKNCLRLVLFISQPDDDHHGSINKVQCLHFKENMRNACIHQTFLIFKVAHNSSTSVSCATLILTSPEGTFPKQAFCTLNIFCVPSSHDYGTRREVQVQNTPQERQNDLYRIVLCCTINISVWLLRKAWQCTDWLCEQSCGEEELSFDCFPLCSHLASFLSP